MPSALKTRLILRAARSQTRPRERLAGPGARRLLDRNKAAYFASPASRQPTRLPRLPPAKAWRTPTQAPDEPENSAFPSPKVLPRYGPGIFPNPRVIRVPFPKITVTRARTSRSGSRTRVYFANAQAGVSAPAAWSSLGIPRQPGKPRRARVHPRWHRSLVKNYPYEFRPQAAILQGALF
jgi:hypothetical protein